MQARARAKGIPNFHIFGEVATGDYDPALLAGWTRRGLACGAGLCLHARGQ
jgi:hypothetical protein